MGESLLSIKERNDIKKKVLDTKGLVLCDNIGKTDLNSYLRELRARGVIDLNDSESIKNESKNATTRDKVEAMIDTLLSRSGDNDEHSLDVLIDVLNHGKHTNLAHQLQNARNREVLKAIAG